MLKIIHAQCPMSSKSSVILYIKAPFLKLQYNTGLSFLYRKINNNKKSVYLHCVCLMYVQLFYRNLQDIS
uniref:Uncharacterized protein n=1 Tax=Anguilla anguilla TaxID=7936 RepID=A0A0E9QU51_ANGAN